MAEFSRRTVSSNIWLPLAIVLAMALYGMCLLIPPPITSMPVIISGPTMGTRYAITLAPNPANSGSAPDVAAIQHCVNDRLAEINRLMSTYEAASELSQFNGYQSADWFNASKETAEVVAEALAIAERTSGAFDPTIGPAVNLWGFGPEKGRVEPPSDAQIAGALRDVGYKNVSVRFDPPALKKSQPGVYLDLSGIAKGYAADAVSDLLDELGYENSMVAIGGEIRTRGRNPDGQPWVVGVESPDNRQPPIRTRTIVAGAGIATSGDYHNFFEHQGMLYSHTIDPTTGRPVRHSTAAVSIVAPTAREADGLATAVLVMGYPEGYDWCLKHSVAALFFVRDDSDMEIRATPGFDMLSK